VKPSLKKIIFAAAGFVLVGIGAVGVVLPLLPTTPFLILAAILFSKSNDRLQKWLLQNRVFGPYFRHYELGTGVSRSLKIRTIVVLWLGLIISAFIKNIIWVWIVLAIVGICVTAHILMIMDKQKIS
jgi:uncharacterized membrane protein YbaN (DUF454 family)